MVRDLNIHRKLMFSIINMICMPGLRGREGVAEIKTRGREVLGPINLGGTNDNVKKI